MDSFTKLTLLRFFRKFISHIDCYVCGFPKLKKESYCINCYAGYIKKNKPDKK